MAPRKIRADSSPNNREPDHGRNSPSSPTAFDPARDDLGFNTPTGNARDDNERSSITSMTPMVSAAAVFGQSSPLKAVRREKGELSDSDDPDFQKSGISEALRLALSSPAKPVTSEMVKKMDRYKPTERRDGRGDRGRSPSRNPFKTTGSFGQSSSMEPIGRERAETRREDKMDMDDGGVRKDRTTVNNPYGGLPHPDTFEQSTTPERKGEMENWDDKGMGYDEFGPLNYLPSPAMFDSKEHELLKLRREKSAREKKARDERKQKDYEAAGRDGTAFNNLQNPDAFDMSPPPKSFRHQKTKTEKRRDNDKRDGRGHRRRSPTRNPFADPADAPLQSMPSKPLGREKSKRDKKKDYAKRDDRRGRARSPSRNPYKGFIEDDTGKKKEWSDNEDSRRHRRVASNVLDTPQFFDSAAHERLNLIRQQSRREKMEMAEMEDEDNSRRGRDRSPSRNPFKVFIEDDTGKREEWLDSPGHRRRNRAMTRSENAFGPSAAFDMGSPPNSRRGKSKREKKAVKDEREDSRDRRGRRGRSPSRHPYEMYINDGMGREGDASRRRSLSRTAYDEYMATKARNKNPHRSKSRSLSRTPFRIYTEADVTDSPLRVPREFAKGTVFGDSTTPKYSPGSLPLRDSTTPQYSPTNIGKRNAKLSAPSLKLDFDKNRKNEDNLKHIPLKFPPASPAMKRHSYYAESDGEGGGGLGKMGVDNSKSREDEKKKGDVKKSFALPPTPNLRSSGFTMGASHREFAHKDSGSESDYSTTSSFSDNAKHYGKSKEERLEKAKNKMRRSPSPIRGRGRNSRRSQSLSTFGKIRTRFHNRGHSVNHDNTQGSSHGDKYKHKHKSAKSKTSIRGDKHKLKGSDSEDSSHGDKEKASDSKHARNDDLFTADNVRKAFGFDTPKKKAKVSKHTGTENYKMGSLGDGLRNRPTYPFHNSSLNANETSSRSRQNGGNGQNGDRSIPRPEETRTMIKHVRVPSDEFFNYIIKNAYADPGDDDDEWLPEGAEVYYAPPTTYTSPPAESLPTYFDEAPPQPVRSEAMPMYDLSTRLYPPTRPREEYTDAEWAQIEFEEGFAEFIVWVSAFIELFMYAVLAFLYWQIIKTWF